MDSRLIVDGELILYGFVGGSFWFDGFSSREVIDALAELDGDITVRINSGGGIAEEGVAIYHALRGYARGNVTTHVDAIAASAASIIAMGGNEVVIPEASLLMIHNASGFTMGDNRAHRKTAQVLDKINAQMGTIYAARTGEPKKAMLDLMADETWLSGSEAVERGFADRAPGADEESEEVEPTAFDYRVYAHAPDSLKQFSERALVRAQHEEKDTMSNVKAPAKTPEKKVATIDDLRAEYPDLVAEIENTAKADAKADAPATDDAAAKAAEDERNRILGIEAHSMPGCEALIADMKKDGKTTPAEAAVKVLQHIKAKGVGHLATLADADKEAEIPAAPSSDDADRAKAPESKGSTPEEWAKEWNESDKLKADFETSEIYVAYMKANSQGRVRILGGRNAK